MTSRLLAFLLAFAPALAFAQPGEHTLNLKDADIRVFIATVSEITGRSFIVDPTVEGKVNVVSSKPMTPDEVYEVFQSVLRVNGFAAVPSGSMIKILPEAIANQQAGAAGVAGGGPDAIVTKLLELRHVSATEMVTLLRPIVPQGAVLQSHQGSNALLITDRAANVARIEALIARIDQSSDAAIEVIPLEHANAAELARTLTTLNDDKTAALNGAQQAKVFADTRTNSLLVSGDRAARLRLRAMITHLDTPLESGESTQVLYLRYSKAEDLVPILEATAQTLTGSTGAKDSVKPANIQAHTETNALIITADPSVFRALASVVRQLDVRRAQVLIEGVIAEVTEDFAREVGVQWFTAPQGDLDTIGQGVIGGTNFPSTTQPGLIGTAVNPLSGLGTGLALGYVDGTVTIGGEEILNLGALVRAVRGDSGSNILAQPSVVTLDHQEAQLKAGQEVPFLTGQYSNTGTGGTNTPTNPFQTIERKDVGLTLLVTPHINEGDSVRLDIEQEVSSLAPSVDGATDLITNKRELKTSVLVGDGAMLVLGGLINDEVRENISKVPGLGDIPVVGNLFRYRKTTRNRRDLMVFLKPTILRDTVLESAVSSEKYNFIRARQLESADPPGPPKPVVDSPVLPQRDPDER
jgi:general secretion pathway protein D